MSAATLPPPSGRERFQVECIACERWIARSQYMRHVNSQKHQKTIATLNRRRAEMRPPSGGATGPTWFELCERAQIPVDFFKSSIPRVAERLGMDEKDVRRVFINSRKAERSRPGMSLAPLFKGEKWERLMRPPSGGATSEPRVCVRCTKPILAIEGCTRAGKGWAHLKCRGSISGAAVDDGATPRLPAEYMELAEKAAEWKAQRDALLAACKAAHKFVPPGQPEYRQLADAIALAEGGA